MRIVTFTEDSGPERLGALVGEQVVDLAVAAAMHVPGGVHPFGDVLHFLEHGRAAIDRAAAVIPWAAVRSDGRCAGGTGAPTKAPHVGTKARANW